jgi:hypothetical protein
MRNLNKQILLITTTLLLSIGFFLPQQASAQGAPDGVNYQAVVRNGLGLPLNNQPVNVRFSIHQGSQTGTVVFTETHPSATTSTNQFGLINLELGSVNNASFSAINWGTGGAYYLQIEVDAGSGFDDLGASQLLSVPYALFARSAATGAQGFNSLIDTVAATIAACPTGGYQVLTGLDTNANTVLDAGEITSSFVVCNGSTGSVNLGDTSATNEFQDLSFNVTNGNLLDISNGIGVPLATPGPTTNGQVLTWSNTNNRWEAQNPGSGVDTWGTDSVNTIGGNILGSGTVSNPLMVIDNDTSKTNELQMLSFNSADSNIIEISLGNGISLASNTPTINGQVLTWDGVNWIAQVPTAGTDSQNLINGGKVGNNQTVNIQNGTGITFSVADEDSIVGNELITNFGINGTLDSLIIDEGPNRNAIPLSALSDGDWTKGIGNDIFNNIDSVGIGTNNPKSLLQLGDFAHLFPLSMGGNEDYSISTYNIHWSGGTSINTLGGPSVITLKGHDSINPIYSVMLFDPQPAGTDMMAFNPSTKMSLKGKGLAINADNPNAALDVRPVDSAAILMQNPDDGSQATLFYESPSFNTLGLRAPLTMPTGSYILTYPTALPSSNGSALISDLSGNLSWGAPPTPFAGWNLLGNAGTVPGNHFVGTTDNVSLEFRTNNTAKMLIDVNGNVGIGETNPQDNLHISDVNPTIRLQDNDSPVTNATGEMTVYDQAGVLTFSVGQTTIGGRIASWEPGEDLHFYSNNGSGANSRMKVSGTNGFVGIGQVGIPSALLTVQPEFGTAASSIVQFNNGSFNNMFDFAYNVANDAYMRMYDGSGNNNIEFHSNGFSYFNGGNVGIGTSLPNVGLEIAGNEALTTINTNAGAPKTAFRIHNDNLTNNNYSSLSFTTMVSNGGTSEMTKIVSQNVNHTVGSVQGDLVFLTRDASNLFERMRIDGNGNVGIGTASSVGALDVNGEINNNARSGMANLVPIAYGQVGSGGAVNNPGTGNWSVVRTGPGNYTITITAESVIGGSHVVGLTMFGTSGFITYQAFAGDILVSTDNTGGTNQDSSFNFIVYKP